MKKDDKIRIKDSGKRKVSVKTSENSTDSNYSYSRAREVVKPKVAKKEEYSFVDNNTSPYYKVTQKKTKNTPKKESYYFSNLGQNENGNRTDSSYSQVIKKPTETKAGSVKTKIRSASVNIKTKTPIPKKKKL